MSMRLSRVLLLTSCIGLLAACSSDKDKVLEEPVDVLYNRATSAMADKNYIEATKYFEEVERQHPYSQWATQAQLMGAYASYKGGHFDEAVIALDRFIDLHPGHKNVDYAYYLKSLCYYEQISDVGRDQEMTAKAVETLTALINRFPDSKYTRDAKLKKDLTIDHLAGKEMEIGRYYLKRGELDAAVNRFRNVAQNYQTTSHVPEALHRLVEINLTLGLTEEATRVAAVLGYNYPGNKWYQRSYDLLDPQARRRLQDKRSFVDRTIETLFKPR